MSSAPLLQLALDYVSLPSALAMALKVAAHVDVIEIGTPLCKAAGTEAIRAIREVCPDKLVLADFKAPDAGGIEAQMAFEAGADMMTVMAGATSFTIKSALEVARRQEREILVDITGVRDIFARADEWKETGVERVVFHRGWDEQEAAREWSEVDLRSMRELISKGFEVTLAGGITAESLPFFRDLPISVVVVGKAIHQAQNPAASAREIRSTIAHLWPES